MVVARAIPVANASAPAFGNNTSKVSSVAAKCVGEVGHYDGTVLGVDRNNRIIEKTKKNALVAGENGNVVANRIFCCQFYL